MKTYAAAFIFTLLFATATPYPTLASHHGSHVVVAPGQPAPRVGPSYLYPDPETTPGGTNSEVTQANIQQTICVKGWTGTIRPPLSYTNTLKKQQLQAARYTDKNPTSYEEDRFISLELGGSPRDAKNFWPEMWGTPGTPLTSRGPFPPSLVGAKAKDQTEKVLNTACGVVFARRVSPQEADADLLQIARLN